MGDNKMEQISEEIDEINRDSIKIDHFMWLCFTITDGFPRPKKPKQCSWFTFLWGVDIWFVYRRIYFPFFKGLIAAHLIWWLVMR